MAKDKTSSKRGPKLKNKNKEDGQSGGDNSSSIVGSSKSENFDEDDQNKSLFKTKRSYIKVENKKRDELIDIVENKGYTIKKAA